MDRERALLDELRDALSLLDKERERVGELEKEDHPHCLRTISQVVDERDVAEKRSARLERALKIIARGTNSAAWTARAALESDEQTTDG